MIIETSGLVALTVVLTQIVKKFKLPARFIPLAAIILGIAIFFVFISNGYTWQELLFLGVIAGLSACGLWDFGKKTIVGK